MHNGTNIDLTVGEDREGGWHKPRTTPRCINSLVATPVEADEAEESEEPREVARGRGWMVI